jgi:hypothetical protein
MKFYLLWPLVLSSVSLPATAQANEAPATMPAIQAQPTQTDFTSKNAPQHTTRAGCSSVRAPRNLDPLASHRGQPEAAVPTRTSP